MINNEIKRLFIPVEPIPTFECIDISSCSTTNKPEFPSEEFGNFMELLTKWNLSDACGSDLLKFSKKICHDDIILPTSVKQGRQLLDQTNIAHIFFKKVPLITYNEDTYYLYYRPIFNAIKELLSNQNIFRYCVFEFNALYHEGQRVYHEQYTGEWWKRIQELLPIGAKVLSIILYSDAMTCDH